MLCSTGGFRGRKSHTHEGGIRVPGIIKWPAGFKAAGLAPGTVAAEPVVGHDIFPTLLEITGVSPPDDRMIDGSSILPVPHGKPLKRRRPLYWRNDKETIVSQFVTAPGSSSATPGEAPGPCPTWWTTQRRQPTCPSHTRNGCSV
ncbi:MAG: sulfatase-like hydrolase/transferase [Akkermansiaceae bacterium]|nr:sulfatase-like hydrolase/transferase [Akkermansiaceae bacterium]